MTSGKELKKKGVLSQELGTSRRYIKELYRDVRNPVTSGCVMRSKSKASIPPYMHQEAKTEPKE